MQVSRTLALSLFAAVPASAQQLVRTIPGASANTMYGKAVVRAGDQNGDGYVDLIVGAPGFDSQCGAIYCLSGAYLASGTGTMHLWFIEPPANSGDLFGYALAAVGDITGDGVADFLVGQPGYDNGTTQDAGAVRLVNGATHAIVSLRYGSNQGGRLGSAVTRMADSTLDGVPEVAVGEPSPNSTSSFAYLLSGVYMRSSGPASAALVSGVGNTVASGVGASVAGGFDLDGDGFDECVIGMPGNVGPAGPNAGGCTILSHVPPNTTIGLFSYDSPIAGERLGESVDMSHDYDGDGVVDIVLGAPKRIGGLNSEVGRAVVLSGARCAANTPPYELYTFAAPTTSTPISMHFGAAVRACDDLNGDGVGEILIGAPDFFTSTPVGPGKGAVSIFSGASGVRIAGLVGANQDHLGGALGGAVNDLDGDGFKEFVVAGALSDAGGTDSGVLEAYRLFPCGASIYCTGKINSAGCTPAISFNGLASASSPSPFQITATNFLDHKNGLFFYSHAPASAAFQGGFKCAANPTVRTAPQDSGGSTGGPDCSGTYAFDFNAWIQGGTNPTAVAGAEVYGQYWARDPLTASHTSLSNAVRFVINP